MNSKNAKEAMTPGDEYKFVARLVPPLLGMAKIDFGTHGKIGLELNLVELNYDLNTPYRPKNPNNFKAGKMKMDKGGEILLTGYSADFTDINFVFSSSEELRAFFDKADIEIFS